MIPSPLRLLAALLLALAVIPASAQGAGEARADSVCVIAGRWVAWGTTRVDSATGDSVVVTADGEASWSKLARQYAAGRDWYERGEPIHLPRPDRRDGKGKRRWGVREDHFYKFREPRQWPPEPGIDGHIRRVAEIDGVPVYAEGDHESYEMYFVPVRPGCWFQVYMPSFIDYVYDKSGGKEQAHR